MKMYCIKIKMQGEILTIISDNSIIIIHSFFIISFCLFLSM